MGNSVKVLEDTVPSAGKLLAEVNQLTSEIGACQVWFQPFGEFQKTQYGTLPRYVMARKSHLSEAKINRFGINYPTIMSVLDNGEASDDGMRRLHDGIYKLGQFNKRLAELKGVIKLDDDREFLLELIKQIHGDLIIFLITQYKLNILEDGIYLSVREYCDREGVTPEVYYGGLLLQLERTGSWPYGYESISEYRDRLIDIDPVFVAECEECNFPLTSEMSQQIIDGTLSLNDARAEVMAFMQQSDETVVEGMTPGNMISKMDLS